MLIYSEKECKSCNYTRDLRLIRTYDMFFAIPKNANYHKYCLLLSFEKNFMLYRLQNIQNEMIKSLGLVWKKVKYKHVDIQKNSNYIKTH